MSITEALHQYGLLDSDGFLVPPEHPKIKAFTKKMVATMQLQAQGIKLPEETKQQLRTMIMVHDYYNEALQDLVDNGSYIDDEDEDDEEDEEDEEDDDEDDDDDDDDEDDDDE